MGLRLRVVRVVAVLLVSAIAVIFTVYWFVIRQAYDRLEEQESQAAFSEFMNGLNAELYRIYTVNRDWSAWDSAYEYVATPNQQFEDENLIQQSYDRLQINLASFVRRDGTIVWKKMYDLKTGEEIDAAELDVSEILPELVDDVPAARERSLYGMWDSPMGLMFIASSPITDSTSSINPNGALIFGRLVEPGAIPGMMGHELATLEISPAPESPPPHLVQPGAPFQPFSLAQATIGIRDGRVHIEGILPEATGTTSLRLVAVAPARITNSTFDAAVNAILLSVFVAIGIPLILGLYVQREIVLPIEHIADAVTAHRPEDPTPLALVDAQRQDELGVLSRSLEALNARVRTELERRQEIARQLQFQLDERERFLKEIQASQEQIALLREFIPICASCKKIRGYEGYWQNLEDYIMRETPLKLSHTFCDDCANQYLKENLTRES